MIWLSKPCRPLHKKFHVKYLIVGTGEEQATLYKTAQENGSLGESGI